MTTAALIPVKRFQDAKQRLASALTPTQRQKLARALASGVVRALDGLDVFVACDDDDVAQWAESHGAHVVWTPGLGLNGAVDAGVRHVAASGADHIIVSHADLALPERLSMIPRTGHISLVPDRPRDGTNALAFPAQLAERWRASYGPGSFVRHLTDAADTGTPVEVRADPALALDVDTAADLTHPRVAARLAQLGIV